MPQDPPGAPGPPGRPARALKARQGQEGPPGPGRPARARKARALLARTPQTRAGPREGARIRQARSPGGPGPGAARRAPGGLRACRRSGGARRGPRNPPGPGGREGGGRKGGPPREGTSARPKLWPRLWGHGIMREHGSIFRKRAARRGRGQFNVLGDSEAAERRTKCKRSGAETFRRKKEGADAVPWYRDARPPHPVRAFTGFIRPFGFLVF